MESTTFNPTPNEQGNTRNEVQETSSMTGLDEEALKKLDIDTMFEKVKGKEAAFQEKNVQFQNKLQMLKADIMKKAFMMMRDLGVDMNDPRSISSFLQDLETQDPDLLALFESAMSGLIPGQEQAPIQGMPAQGMPGVQGEIPMGEMPQDPSSVGSPNLMEQNTTNLQENMLRQ